MGVILDGAHRQRPRAEGRRRSRSGWCSSRAPRDRARHAVRRVADRAHTMGSKITKLQPVGGMASETRPPSSLVPGDVRRASRCRRPTRSRARSSGVGTTQRLSAVRWGVAGRVDVGLGAHDPWRVHDGLRRVSAVEGAHVRTIGRRTWVFLTIVMAMLLLYEPTPGQVPLGQPRRWRDWRRSGSSCS